MDSLRREESATETFQPSLVRRIKSAGRKVHECERGGDYLRVKDSTQAHVHAHVHAQTMYVCTYFHIRIKHAYKNKLARAHVCARMHM